MVVGLSGWVGSNRRERLPADWQVIRRRVLARDGYRCCWVEQGVRCVERATDVDHVSPGDNDDLTNLQALCGFHHGVKSGRDGGRASARARAARESRGLGSRRPPEGHPGDPG